MGTELIEIKRLPVRLGLLQENGVRFTSSSDEWTQLSEQYRVPIEDIRLIDLNRSGIYLPDNKIRVGFRARFIVDFDGYGQTWLALPVRERGDTNFQVSSNGLYFQNTQFGNTSNVYLDICDVSYQRGPRLLNLNSRSRSNCSGCTACVHNYKDLYDSSVLNDQKRLVTKEDIERFFDQKEKEGLQVANLDQIAIVTGLFGGEAAVVKHMQLVADTVNQRGFNGELMYFGCQVNSDAALEALSKLGNVAIIYAIDNFTRREEILARKKSRITVPLAKDTLDRARSVGIDTSFAYIAGIDDLLSMGEGFELLAESITRFPVVNIYQVQTLEQILIMNPEAKDLEYYLKARKVIEGVFGHADFRPRRWENYRPLWYVSYDGESLTDDAFGNLAIDKSS